MNISGTLPAEEIIGVAQAMAASNGPDQVKLLDWGLFWREELPALPLRLKPTSVNGWFESPIRPTRSDPYRGAQFDPWRPTSTFRRCIDTSVNFADRDATRSRRST